MRRHLIAVFTLIALALALVPATPAFAAPPPNDDFADATLISGAQGSVNVSLDEATLEPGEPEYRTTPSFPTPHRSVWFRWTAPADGWYRFELENAGADDCIGTSPVFQGDTLEELTQRSRHSATDIWESTDVSFVNVLEGRTLSIAAASNCYPFGYDLDLVWERRGPLIIKVARPDGSGEPGVVVNDCDANSPAGECYEGFLIGKTDATGRVYFALEPHHYGKTLTYKLSPGSPNLAPRIISVAVPPATRKAVAVSRGLRAMPVVDLDRDGRGDIVSGVPLADRGRANAGAVVVMFGDGRRRVLDEASAGIPSDRATGEQFGSSVVAGDVNRDGWTDLTIGAPGEMIGTVRAGAVFVVFGSNEGLGNGRATMRVHQDTAGVAGVGRSGDRFGAAVVPGIRVSDRSAETHFLVGAPGKDIGDKANAGVVVRFSRFGRTTTPSMLWHQGTPGVGGSNVAGDRFGSALATGAFDNQARESDQSADLDRGLSLAVGVPGKNVGGARDAGAIVVLRGIKSDGTFAQSGHPLLSQNSTAVVPGNGARAGNAFGSSLAAFRAQTDVVTLGYAPWRFPDGPDWLAVGAPGDGGGSVTVLGSAKGAPLVFAPAADNKRLVQGAGGVSGGNEAGDRFGTALAVGDLNDDREPDLVVGAPGEDVDGRNAAGAVTLLYGERGDGSASCCRWNVIGSERVGPGIKGVAGGPWTGARFGAAVASVDVQGDGYPDIVAGAPGYDSTATNTGAVFAVYSTARGVAGGKRVLWPEARANDGFGGRLAAPQLLFSHHG